MNRFSPKQTSASLLPRILSRVVIFVIGIFALLYGLSAVSDSADRGQADSLKQAISRSALHCYATEGRYPESLAYLQEHYGITWDSTRYAVDYEVFASNLMPSVTVIPLSH